MRKLHSCFSEVVRFAKQNVQDKSEKQNIPKSSCLSLYLTVYIFYNQIYFSNIIQVRIVYITYLLNIPKAVSYAPQLIKQVLNHITAGI